MRTNYELRYASNPEDAKHYDTARLRRDFLIDRLFTTNEVNMVYSMYDRMIVGGAMPAGEELKLEAIDPLKAPHFTTRREIGIYNVGEGKGTVRVGEETFELGFKEALYIGSGDRDVFFSSNDASKPAKFYFNSTTAHTSYPCRKITKKDAISVHMGSLEMSNERTINKMIVNQVLPTCQLQMGMTEFKTFAMANYSVYDQKAFSSEKNENYRVIEMTVHVQNSSPFEVTIPQYEAVHVPAKYKEKVCYVTSTVQKATKDGNGKVVGDTIAGFAGKDVTIELMINVTDMTEEDLEECVTGMVLSTTGTTKKITRNLRVPCLPAFLFVSDTVTVPLNRE